MVRNQGLQHLFDNGDSDGLETHEHFAFDVEEDIEAMETLRDSGEASLFLRHIMTMEKRLSKAQMVVALAGQGGVLVDDSWAKSIYDAQVKNVMYIHVDLKGITTTAERLAELLRSVA